MVECWFDYRGVFVFLTHFFIKKFFSIEPHQNGVENSSTIEGPRSVSVKKAYFLIDKSVFEIQRQFLNRKSVSDK